MGYTPHALQNPPFQFCSRDTHNKNTSGHYEIRNKIQQNMNQDTIDLFHEKPVGVLSLTAAMFVQASMWVKWEWVNIPADRL